MKRWLIEMETHTRSTRKCYAYAESAEEALEMVLGNQRIVAANCSAIDEDVAIVGTRVFDDGDDADGAAHSVTNESGERIL